MTDSKLAPESERPPIVCRWDTGGVGCRVTRVVRDDRVEGGADRVFVVFSGGRKTWLTRAEVFAVLFAKRAFREGFAVCGKAKTPLVEGFVGVERVKGIEPSYLFTPCANRLLPT